MKRLSSVTVRTMAGEETDYAQALAVKGSEALAPPAGPGRDMPSIIPELKRCADEGKIRQFYEFAAGPGLVDYRQEFSCPDFCLPVGDSLSRLDCSR